MPLHRSNSLKQAQAILDLLDNDPRLDTIADAESLFVRPFVSGREQGYAIFAINPTTDEIIQISFAENRSSDDIVVYRGEPSWTKLLAETVTNPKYFKYGSYEQASEYITGLITKHLGL